MTEVAPPATSLAPNQLTFITEALATAAALDAAHRLGLLARLEAGPADVPTLVSDCCISERGLRPLLAVLRSLGLLDTVGDGSFRAAVPGLSKAYGLRAQWDCLSEVIRDDRPAVAVDRPSGAETLYPNVVPFLGALFASSAERFADQLGSPAQRILDVGAGAAPWSLALARQDPTCYVTAVDLPAILPATRHAVAAAGVAAQFEYLGGDFFVVDWGSESYDLAILGNICHLFGEGANHRLLARIYDALRPGGSLAILDILPNEGLDCPRSVALYALGLILRTGSGQVYPFSTYVNWLREAGFQGIERIDLSDVPPVSLIVARRPS